MKRRYAILLILAASVTCAELMLPKSMYTERGIRENAQLAAESIFFHRLCDGRQITVDLISGFYSVATESQSTTFDEHVQTAMAELAKKIDSQTDDARATLCEDLNESINRRRYKYGFH